MRGDIDGDGKITENDRNRISEHLGGTITLTGADSWCAKVTGNNEISVSDLVQLVQYLEGKTNNLTGIPTFADYYNNWTYHKVDDLTGYWTAEVVINGLKTTSDAIVNISNDEGIFYKSELSDGATAHKLYHTTLCNHLLILARRATTTAELDKITYSADCLPPDLAENMKKVLTAAGY